MASIKILVVDDDESILVLLEKRLQTDGYQIIKAATGKEAVSKAQLFSPHLIIMDIMLPDVDGPEAFKRIRAHPGTCHIPVVFLSGIVEETGDTPPTVTIDNETYTAVSKPIDFALLSNAIHKNILEGEEDSGG